MSNLQHIIGRFLQSKIMKKSIMSKKGSCLSFFTGTCKDDAALEIMKISVKKEVDRREKLQKLLAKYDQIHAIERQHVKSLKANIIELKDVSPVSKIRFLVDPNIYVNNNLSVQTREFLCMLLNTFYKRYAQNEEHEKKAAMINENIKIMLKSISNNEELLFKVQKTNINTQVQLEGEMLSEKAKLKELNQKQKELDTEEKRVRIIWSQRKERYEEEEQKVEALRQIMGDLESKIIGLTEKINEGQEIKQGNQHKLSGQMVYQLKFEQEVNQLKQIVTKQLQKSIQLKKKIRERQITIDKLKGHINYDNNRHKVQMKILDLQQPRPSTKYNDVSELLQIQRKFERAMTKSHSTMFKTL